MAGGNPNNFSVLWNGAPIYAQTDLPSTTSYAKYSFTEVATGPTTALAFTFRDDPAYLFLDDAVVSAVPEPVYFVATGVGLAALLLANKRCFA